jgi:cytochrome b6-f complex iron-sulfur subunit
MKESASREMTQKKKSGINRRSFLKIAGGTLGGLVALEMGVITFAYMQPRLGEGDFGAEIVVGAVDDYPPGSVTHIQNGRFYLARLEDGGFLALYQRCTHLGCSVPWDQAKGEFICPCHNSQFSMNGDVQNPPAPRPLDIFPIRIEDGMIKVDTSKPVNREKFNQDQVVYA